MQTGKSRIILIFNKIAIVVYTGFHLDATEKAVDIPFGSQKERASKWFRIVALALIVSGFIMMLFGPKKNT